MYESHVISVPFIFKQKREGAFRHVILLKLLHAFLSLFYKVCTMCPPEVRKTETTSTTIRPTKTSLRNVRLISDLKFNTRKLKFFSIKVPPNYKFFMIKTEKRAKTFFHLSS